MKSFKNIIMVVLIMGVMTMVNSKGFSESIKYENYSTKDSELNFTVDKIFGWLVSEQRGSSDNYSQIIFFEPINAGSFVKGAIDITAQENSKTGYSNPVLEVIADDILRKRLKMKDAVMLERAKGVLNGLESWTMEVSYKSLEKPNSVKPNLITIKEKIIVFAKGNKFYTLRYQNKIEAFNKYSKAFDYIISTLKFKGSDK